MISTGNRNRPFASFIFLPSSKDKTTFLMQKLKDQALPKATLSCQGYLWKIKEEVNTHDGYLKKDTYEIPIRPYAKLPKEEKKTFKGTAQKQPQQDPKQSIK